MSADAAVDQVPDTGPLWRNKKFQLLWTGSVFSALGTQLTSLAYPLLVLVLTGSPGLTGLVGAAGFAVTLLFSLPGGVWADRWDRRRLMLGCEAVRAVAMGTVAVAVALGQITVAHLVAVAAINGAAGAVFAPAREVAIRTVVRSDQLATAYSQEQARSYGATLAGPPLGGALFTLGRAVPFIADAVSFAVSFVCVALAKVPRGQDAPPAKQSLRADVADAAKWLWGQRMLRAVCLFVLVVNLGGAMLSLPIIVLVQERGGGPAVVGLVVAGMGAGGLIGALIAPRLTRLMPVNRLLLAVCGVNALLVLAVIAPFGPYWPGVVLLLSAMLVPAISVPLQVEIAQRTPVEMMARVYSVVGLASSAIMPLAPIIGGFLTGGIGASWTIVVSACIFALCFVGGTLSPALRGTPQEPAPFTAG